MKSSSLQIFTFATLQSGIRNIFVIFYDKNFDSQTGETSLVGVSGLLKKNFGSGFANFGSIRFAF